MKHFSAAARAELARVIPEEACCIQAELGGILRSAGSLHLHGRERVSLTVQTEHADVARKVVVLFRALGDLPAEVMVEEHEHPRHVRLYQLQIRPRDGAKRLLTTLGLLGPEGLPAGDIPAALVRKACCRAAFLRGAYMMRGSVCDPRGSSYHLEIVAGGEEFGLGLCYLLNLVRLKAHVAVRKEQHVVYMKDADNIASFLSLIGANAARLELEEVRVVKDVRGGVNRLVNAETANVDKAVIAAMEQIEMIEKLRGRGQLDKLPPALRELAVARLRHPEATLAELGQILAKPVSKSAVNHRLRRLRRYAETMPKE